MELNKFLAEPKQTPFASKVSTIKEEKQICGVRYCLVSWNGLSELSDTWVRVSLLEKQLKKNFDFNSKKILEEKVREPFSDITHVNTIIAAPEPKEDVKPQLEKPETEEIEKFDFSHKNFEEKLGKRKAWKTENFYDSPRTNGQKDIKKLKVESSSHKTDLQKSQKTSKTQKNICGPSTLETVSNQQPQSNFILQNTEQAFMDSADQLTDINSISGKESPVLKKRTIEHLFYSPIPVRKVKGSQEKGGRIFSQVNSPISFQKEFSSSTTFKIKINNTDNL